jgi:NAD(P)-dependent dehydrogenase (short-subunit alcohol dehydrogenase family)
LLGRALRVNLKGAFLVGQAAARRMVAGGAQAGVPATGPRAQPIDSGIDSWFLDRLFGRR